MLDSLITVGHDVSNVCVSHITNLSKTFYNQGSFNQDISIWDVRNVINMDSLFFGCTQFNIPIGNWNTSV